MGGLGPRTETHNRQFCTNADEKPPEFYHEELRGRTWMIIIAKDSHTVASKRLYTENKSVTVGAYCLFLGIQIDNWMLPHNDKKTPLLVIVPDPE